ncbi:Uncharacterised protein [Bordetella pertussis]|nr:Uncharacterised protein [Bordetella pertussis]
MPRAAHPVHPPLPELMALEEAVGGLSFVAGQPLGSVLAGLHGSRLRGRGLDFGRRPGVRRRRRAGV